MWKRLQLLGAKLNRLRPRAALWRTLALAALMLVAVGLGVIIGRYRPLSDDQVDVPQPALPQATLAPAPSGEPGQRVVAYVYGNVPITRAELGEFAIARYGADRVEILVNRRLVEMACRPKGIFVTDAEVEAQFKEDLQRWNITASDFNTYILRRFRKTVYEYKEDMVRLKLLLAKLVRPTINVTAEDLQNAFEARYHEKIQCRMIVLRKEDRPRWGTIWAQASKGEAEFDQLARTQFIDDLAAPAGKVPPIHKHFGDARIEKEAFQLKDGQVSQLLEMPDGTCVILKRDRLIPADTTTQLPEVRLTLHREVTELKVAMAIENKLQQLREEARPQVFLRPRQRQDNVAASATPILPSEIASR